LYLSHRQGHHRPAQVHTAADFIAFLNKIDRKVTDDLDVHFHFTPTYGSWMNLVGAPQRPSARPGHPRLGRDLERQPRPFTWHKSAEEILDRLAGYCCSLNK